MDFTSSVTSRVNAVVVLPDQVLGSGHRVVEQGLDFDVLGIKRELARLDARQVEHVVDQVQQMLAGARYPGQRFLEGRPGRLRRRLRAASR